jgi:hypothetical protein
VTDQITRLHCGCEIHSQPSPWVHFCGVHAVAFTLYRACLTARTCGHDKPQEECKDLCCAVAATAGGTS